MRTLFVFLGFVFAPLLVNAQPLEQRAETVLRRALDAAAQRQVYGGWGRAYTQDGALMWGEYRAIQSKWITVQPPATPEVARVFLRAAQVLHEDKYRECARRAKEALLKLQTPDGGFPHEGDPALKNHPTATFDDDTTTAALRFLIAWWQETQAAEDLRIVKRVGDFIVKAQYADSGGWPQEYPPPKDRYARHITFNDNNINRILDALLRLHELTHEPRYLEAAKKGGECILRLQGGPGEEIWAQQYDPAALTPAWARKFEPPGYSPCESIGVCDALIDLYAATGEERFLAPLPKAFAWYDTHRLPNGKYARLYEPGTQRPVYGRRDKAEPVYDFANACSGYAWQEDWYPRAAKHALEVIQSKGREAWLKERNAPQNPPDAKNLAPRVLKCCETLNEEGCWLSDPGSDEIADLQQHHLPATTPIIEMGRFNEHARLLLDYLEAAKAIPPKSP